MICSSHKSNSEGPRARAIRADALRLVAPDDPHREELRAAAVRVAECLPGLELDLVVAGPAAHLLRGFAEADHARRADRVRRQHAARRVPRDVAVGRGGPGLGELPPVAFVAEA